MTDRADDVDDPTGTGPGHVLVRHPVPPVLAGLVTRFTGYREMSRRPVRMTETASLVVPVIVSFGAPFAIAVGREPGPEDRIASFTGGLTSGPVRIASEGGAHCVQIDFTPLGAYRFLGRPMHELSERLVQLDDLGDPALARLRERLGQEPSWRRRFALVEATLASRLLGSDGASPGVAWAYGRIVETGGVARIGALASHLGWSRKHLAVRFREEVGLAPKTIARIARFGRAQEMALAGAGSGWADIAAACGYADQPHLVRDFVALGGSTPTAWRTATG